MSKGFLRKQIVLKYVSSGEAYISSVSSMAIHHDVAISVFHMAISILFLGPKNAKKIDRKNRS